MEPGLRPIPSIRLTCFRSTAVMLWLPNRPRGWSGHALLSHACLVSPASPCTAHRSTAGGTPEQVAAALRPYGVRTEQVWSAPIIQNALLQLQKCGLDLPELVIPVGVVGVVFARREDDLCRRGRGGRR